MILGSKILSAVSDGVAAIAQLRTPRALAFLESVAAAMAAVYERRGKIIVAGNGGSLCDAMHMAEELTGYFRAPRRALAAIALSDPGHLSCVGNDVGFEEVFARGIEAHGQPGDLFVGLTTSGNSPNMVRAFAQAKEQGLQRVAFLGQGGGKLKGVADHELVIEGFATSDRIQEAHMCAIHILIELLEALLFADAAHVKA